MIPELKKALDRSKTKRSEIKKFLEKLRGKPPRNLDDLAQKNHEKVFDEVDCLKCANCCKTTSPIFRMVDIERISRHLRVKPADFIAQNLYIDSDGDHVLNSSPCLFLDQDNYCSIYSVRPNACREYPHTDRKNFHQITALTYANTQMCPVAAIVVERLMTQIKT